MASNISPDLETTLSDVIYRVPVYICVTISQMTDKRMLKPM